MPNKARQPPINTPTQTTIEKACSHFDREGINPMAATRNMDTTTAKKVRSSHKARNHQQVSAVRQIRSTAGRRVDLLKRMCRLANNVTSDRLHERAAWNQSSWRLGRALSRVFACRARDNPRFIIVNREFGESTAPTSGRSWTRDKVRCP